MPNSVHSAFPTSPPPIQHLRLNACVATKNKKVYFTNAWLYARPITHGLITFDRNSGCNIDNFWQKEQVTHRDRLVGLHSLLEELNDGKLEISAGLSLPVIPRRAMNIFPCPPPPLQTSGRIN